MSSTTAVSMIVGFVLAVASIAVVTQTMQGFVGQSSDRAIEDDLEDLRRGLVSECDMVQSGSSEHTTSQVDEIQLGEEQTFTIENSGTMIITDPDRVWGLPSDCDYVFDGSEVDRDSDGGVLETGQNLIWAIGYEGDADSGNIDIRACSMGSEIDEVSECEP